MYHPSSQRLCCWAVIQSWCPFNAGMQTQYNYYKWCHYVKHWYLNTNIIINREEAKDNFKCMGAQKTGKCVSSQCHQDFYFTQEADVIFLSFVFQSSTEPRRFLWTKEKVLRTKLISFINLSSQFHFIISFPFLFLASEPNPQSC